MATMSKFGIVGIFLFIPLVLCSNSKKVGSRLVNNSGGGYQNKIQSLAVDSVTTTEKLQDNFLKRALNFV